MNSALYTSTVVSVNGAVHQDCGSQFRQEVSIDLFAETQDNSLVMRAVLQRVNHAEVLVDGAAVAGIGKGILALVAISREDSFKDLHWMASKIVQLRIFNDDQGKLNRSLQDIEGQLLVVSQFTLYGDCRKGRRPSYSEAAPPVEAEKMYEEFVAIVRGILPGVQTGKFQAMMNVSLTNDGPVTLILESRHP